MNLLTMNKFHKNAKVLVVSLMIAMCICSAIMPCFAFDGGAAVGAAIDIVMGIITQAAMWVGVIISIWGIFQIIMAMRREDSEAISKQIMTIVVGAVLIAFSFAAPELIDVLTQGA